MQVSVDMEAMASRGTTSTTSCTFTSFYSTWDGKQFADCCATSKAFAFVFCDQCDTDLELARCSMCYAKFASKLNRRLPEIASSMGANPHFEPVVQAFAAPWAKMARANLDYDQYVRKKLRKYCHWYRWRP